MFRAWVISNKKLPFLGPHVFFIFFWLASLKTSIAPENWWLGEDFPFEARPIFSCYVSFLGSVPSNSERGVK